MIRKSLLILWEEINKLGLDKMLSMHNPAVYHLDTFALVTLVLVCSIN